MAVALRPDRPSAHTVLCNAWRALGNKEEAEASVRWAIELGRSDPSYFGGLNLLGVVLTDKEDFDGNEASLRAALAISPDNYSNRINLAFVYHKRGDLLGAEEWMQNAAAVIPAWVHNRGYYEQARNQWVAERARLDEVAAGRAEPKCTDEAVASIRQVIHPARLRYERAVRLYVWLFDKEPALADDLAKGHRYALTKLLTELRPVAG